MPTRLSQSLTTTVSYEVTVQLGPAWASTPFVTEVPTLDRAKQVEQGNPTLPVCIYKVTRELVKD